jgi:hypothetical protein
MSTLREADSGALGESLDSAVDLDALAAIEQRARGEHAHREQRRRALLIDGEKRGRAASPIAGASR